MGRGVDHPAWNFTYFKPPGSEDCEDLRVFVARKRVTDMPSAIVTCWELSDEELEEIARTKRIFMQVLGAGLPPHFIASESVMRGFTQDYGATW